ncbi:ANTAR domain-containing protein [Streptomyces sp. NPDC004111]|uniref:ANTAR domain-containing protein n=1 Tax=Streptomyces sp. NPDC004111 TaxID=3364690 RepID=UPI00369ABBDB
MTDQPDLPRTEAAPPSETAAVPDERAAVTGKSSGSAGELDRLRAELRHLRARTRTHPLIAQAQGILQERYSLPDGESAFALLQSASQQHNIRMRLLVEAVVRTSGPDPRSTLWFPGRRRLAPPPLTYEAAKDVHSGNGERPGQGAVLRSVLSQTLAVLDTDMGNVQLPDRVRGGLRLEHHTGLSEDFVDFFAHVGEDGTSCAKAARDVAQVTINDVESAPVFDEPSRRAILDAGSLASHSAPLVTPNGICVGMVSAHLDHRVDGFSAPQRQAMAELGAQAGRWLAWYNHTVLMDALESLHSLGLRHRGTRSRRR